MREDVKAFLEAHHMHYDLLDMDTACSCFQEEIGRAHV